MDSRTKSILETSIEEFISTGRPITSNELSRKYDFGIRSAMIRRELNELDNAGFLFQIHPSSGRVPTNKGYRFFVKALQDEKLDEYIPEEEVRQFINGLLSRKRKFLADLAEYLNALSAVYNPDDNEFYSFGLEGLFSSVEIEDKLELGRIIRDFEMLPWRLSETRGKADFWDRPQIYIGRNPFTRSSYLSVISEKFGSQGDEFILLTVGPRRMDYRKLLCLYRLFENETGI